VPVPAYTNEAVYRYRLDFKYNDFGGPKRDSVLSETYELKVLDE
jgi:hypothetical protein